MTKNIEAVVANFLGVVSIVAAIESTLDIGGSDCRYSSRHHMMDRFETAEAEAEVAVAVEVEVEVDQGVFAYVCADVPVL